MKKSQLKLLILFSFPLLLIAPLKWAYGQTAPAVTAETAQMKAAIVKAAGDVRIRNRGSIAWHDAKVNEVLGAGDSIETKENGKIEIRLENGNVINLKSNSKLILQKLSRDLKTGDYENLLESNIGKIRAKVEKIKDSSEFQIKTPTAVAAVRGTTMYLDILPNITDAFFEGGIGTLTNTFSGSTENVGDGKTSSSDNQGNVSEPQEASDEQQSEWHEEWETEGGAEGYSEPEGGGENLGSETDDLQENFQDSQNEAQNDRQNSQNTELTPYEGSPLLGDGTPPTGSTPPTGTGTDGGPTDDTDGDGIADSSEVDIWKTDPLVADADADRDHIPDIEDAFANSVNLDSTDADIYGSRDRLRQRTKELIDQYRWEEYMLRQELQDMIDDTEIRHLDADMAQIADAQTGKVLTDRMGNRVRVEQYVLRPSSDTVEVLSVNLRTGESPHAGLSTLDWITRFGGQDLDGLTGAQLRALPWNDYLEAPSSGDDLVGTGPNYDRNPSNFPTFMSVELKNPSNSSFYEERALASPKQVELGWAQQITRDRIKVNGGELKDFTVNRILGSGIGNPNGFKYDPAGGGSEDEIEFRFYVIGDNENTGLIGDMGSKNFNNMWEALAVNMNGAPSRMNIGNNNLEIRISGSSYSKDIDVIYVPFTRLEWNDSHSWDK